MTRTDIDSMTRYLTMALMAFLIVALLIVVILPNTETRSTCTGFQYFVFLDQKMTSSGYSMELLNGIRDIDIKSASLDGVDLDMAGQRVPAGDVLLLESYVSSRKANETFVNKISVSYDIVNGIKDNTDFATCTGRVQ